MTKFSENIIGKIKCERIAPVPRWHFLLKNYVFWTLLFFSVLLGSLSLGVIIHIINSGDFDIVNHLSGNLFVSSVMLLPYFWLFFLFIFGLVAYFNWKHTKIGYRFKRRWIFLGGFFFSLIVGSIFYSFGLSRKIDLIMNKSLPFYNYSKHRARLDLWQQPERGFLIGKIIEVSENDEEYLKIEDANGNQWQIGNKSENKSKKQLQGVAKQGEIVKIVGEKDGNNCFVARDIRKCKDCDGVDDDYGGSMRK